MMPDMEPIVSLLPEGWQEKAKELGAFTRRGDYIETPEDLLRILLLWADLGTYGITAAFLRTTRDYPLSKVAIFERVKKSASWLQWLVVNFCYKQGYLVNVPGFLSGYRVLVTDATKISKPGSNTADYALHSLIELFSLTTVEQHLTNALGGESMTNFSSLQSNDIVVGDRAYGTITSMRWVEDHQAYFVFRMKANSFNLFAKNEQGGFERFDLTEKLTDWEEGKILNYNLFYKKGNDYFPVRVCAKGKTDDAIKKGSARIKRSNHGENRTKVTPLQAIYNRFIVVITNLPLDTTAEQVLELYRSRWQIELVFKRLKSILKFDELQVKHDFSANAWLWAKLLIAAICETYIQQSAFFPCDEALAEQCTKVFMVGIRSCLRRADFAYS